MEKQAVSEMDCTVICSPSSLTDHMRIYKTMTLYWSSCEKLIL